MSEVSVTKVPVPTSVEVPVTEPFEAFYHREFAGLVRLAMVLVDSQEQAERGGPGRVRGAVPPLPTGHGSTCLHPCVGADRQPQGPAPPDSDASPSRPGSCR